SSSIAVSISGVPRAAAAWRQSAARWFSVSVRASSRTPPTGIVTGSPGWHTLAAQVPGAVIGIETGWRWAVDSVIRTDTTEWGLFGPFTFVYALCKPRSWVARTSELRTTPTELGGTVTVCPACV